MTINELTQEETRRWADRTLKAIYDLGLKADGEGGCVLQLLRPDALGALIRAVAFSDEVTTDDAEVAYAATLQQCAEVWARQDRLIAPL